MNLLKQSAERIIKEYSNELLKKGIDVSAISEGTYSFEVALRRGNEKIKLLVYFGKKGNKTVLQGNKESKLYNTAYEIIFGETIFQQYKEEIDEPEIYIGTDESGKGDYFGPLIIAGVYVNPATITKLKKAGVRDSKELSDFAIKEIAGKIKIITEKKYDLVTIYPEKYNDLYEKFNNVNRLLGWAHAKVLENILSRSNAPEAISDKFGDESFIANSLQESGKKIVLHQFTKAEKYTAVAAASILARNKFNEWFERKNAEIKFQLPKGASITVEEKAKQLKNLYGDEFLSKLVKLHFKTSKKINLNL